MPTCSAFGCTNRSSKSIPGITFHSFPKDPKKRELWVKATRRKDWYPSNSSKLCSTHFPEQMIDRTSLSCVRLREDAVPTIFKAFPSYLQQEYNPRKPPAPRCSTSDEQFEANSIPQIMPVEIEVSGNVSNENVSPSKAAFKRKIVELEDVVASKNKKIKALEQKVKRYKKRYTDLKQLFEELKEKNLMEDDSLDILKTVSDVNKEFLSRQLSSVTDKPLPTSYSKELRAFALTLHFYSPRAYEFVRNTFNLALPHQRTLSRWYQCIDGNPGFTKESFDALDAKLKNCNSPLYFALVMDEMAVRQHVEYDGHDFHGYINIGISETDDCLPLAKEAFVLLIVCINDNWKLPLGYFFTDGMNSAQRANLVKTCLVLLKNVNANVVSLTFDGLAANLRMIKLLGCSIEFENLKTTFKHPSHDAEIAVFLDPAHMLKLIRNTFGEKKSLFYDGEIIDWKYVEELHKLQEMEGLHLANKLRKAHIYFKQQKMKVKLAAQVFSRSVADAIDYCDVKLNLPEFAGSRATVEFLKLFNDLFDVLNSRSQKQLGFKKALNKDNMPEIINFLNKANDYICKLKTAKNGTKIIDSNRKTGFLGFKVNIHSALSIAENMICSKILYYFPFYKLSQDHLELLFSSIRFHGGSNNNPTAKQFRAAYKKLLVCAELKASRSGNCIPLSEISILSVPSNQSSINVINFTSKNTLAEEFNQPENESSNALVEHDYLFDAGILSECSQDIVYYIAGFTVKKLMDKIKCFKCQNVLQAVEPPQRVSLISFKTHGKLIYPSEDVYKICNISESTFRRFISSRTTKPIHKKINVAEIQAKILSCLQTINLFSSLQLHQFDTNPLDNHYVHLIKAIVNQYMTIRLKYYSKCLSSSNSIRQLYTKAILFKGD